MKNIIAIIFLLCCVSVFAQTGTTSIKKENTKTYQVSETSWTFSTPAQVISGLTAPDTLIISGDTILTDWPDTLVVNFPFDFYDSYNGHTTIRVEPISGETALTIAKVVTFGANCATCEWVKISEDTSEPYDFTVPDMRLRLEIIATAGTGRITTKTILKAN